MSNVENMVLEQLKALGSDILSFRTENQNEFSEIKHRLSCVESGVARIAREEASNYGEIIENRHMFDKLAERIGRIEKRLELSSS